MNCFTVVIIFYKPTINQEKLVAIIQFEFIW